MATRSIEATIMAPPSPAVATSVPSPASQAAAAVTAQRSASLLASRVSDSPRRLVQSVAPRRALAAPQPEASTISAPAAATARQPQARVAPPLPLDGTLPAAPAPAFAEPRAVPAGVSAEDLRAYRVSLAVAARRFKSYPPLAREQGWEGSVEIAVDLRAWRAPEVSLARSSGRAVLDRQALTIIEQAAAATTPPGSLAGRDFRLLLPIEFALDSDR